MQARLAAHGRKMVTIVDPHIKRDEGYHVYRAARDQGLLVKRRDGGGDFEGTCWPGQSVWIDFVSAAGREFWAGLFSAGVYGGSSATLFTWNDMNEPSVFSGPEVTMPKDVAHGAYEHREVHNLYGHYMTEATYKGTPPPRTAPAVTSVALLPPPI
jgi:mannosyl-oligosaccharide alpha-1,3-glucosidase